MDLLREPMRESQDLSTTEEIVKGLDIELKALSAAIAYKSHPPSREEPKMSTAEEVVRKLLKGEDVKVFVGLKVGGPVYSLYLIEHSGYPFAINIHNPGDESATYYSYETAGRSSFSTIRAALKQIIGKTYKAPGTKAGTAFISIT